jgi:DNA-binding beta-propeller fold protein YncE
VPGAREAKASPKLTTTYVLGAQTLTIIDWEQPAAIHRIPLETSVHLSPRFLAVTPDGKYVFLANTSITRFRVEGTELVEEQSGPVIGSHPLGLCVSPDSKLVCLPSGGGTPPQPGFPAVGNGTYLFGVEDLRVPKLAITTGPPSPIAVGFDPRSGEFYANDHHSLLKVFSPGGAQQKVIAGQLGEVPGTRRLYVHPDGGRLLVKSESSLLWLQPSSQPDASASSKKPATPPRTAAGKPSAPAGGIHREWLDQAPRPTVGSRSLLRHQREVGGVRVTTLDLAGEALVEPPLWSPGGEFFVVLDNAGTLRKVRLADFTEIQKLELGAACTGLGLASCGLVIAVGEWQAVVCVDLDTFRIVSRTDIPAPQQLAAAPASDLVFVGSRSEYDTTMSVVDLATQSIRWQFTIESFMADMRRLTPGLAGLPHVSFHLFALTPDGRFLFVEGMSEFSRFRVEDQGLVFEETASVRCDNPCRFAVSSDSKLVALPAGGGNRMMEVGRVERGVTPYATWVFAVENLKQPKTIVASGAWPQTLAFDPQTKHIYAQNRNHQLLVFNEQGKELKELKLSEHDDTRILFAPHPKGGRLLVSGGTETWWVDLSPPPAAP